MVQGIEGSASGLLRLRERTGLSRQGLVNLLPEGAKITAHQLYKIESGRSKTALSTAFALADVLSDALGERVTIDDIFPMPNDDTPDEPDPDGESTPEEASA